MLVIPLILPHPYGALYELHRDVERGLAYVSKTIHNIGWMGADVNTLSRILKVQEEGGLMSVTLCGLAPHLDTTTTTTTTTN